VRAASYGVAVTTVTTAWPTEQNALDPSGLLDSGEVLSRRPTATP
jgi:hypothetical protein